MRWKRPLYLFHRWAGIVLCVFFALWFLSGAFMMYVEFPQLTPPESRVGQASIDFSSAQWLPGAAVAQLTAGDFSVAGTPARLVALKVDDPRAPIAPSKVQLGMLAGRPVYRIYVPGAQPRVVHADTGEVLNHVTQQVAVEAARDFAARAALVDDTSAIRYAQRVQTDQWTVSAALDAHRPLHRIELGDRRDTHLYVSSTTGEIVRDTHRRERVLNYFGAVTHWIYPTVLRRHPVIWEWLVDILSAAGTLLAISGVWIGILRWRRKRRPTQSITPYRGLMRWHHLIGLGFGLTAVTWVFSGLLSMNPVSINPSRAAAPAEALVYAGKALAVEDFVMPPAIVLPEGTVEAQLVHYDGQPLYRATARDGAVRLVSARPEHPRLPGIDAVVARAGELLPDAALERVSVLDDYDNYYYTRHPDRGGKPLPVVRVRFRDDQRTWFHVDPGTGEVLDRSTRFNRAYRWLYNGLHSWDIRWLWERRPLWDIALLSFTLGGCALSVLGMVLGIRRLRWELGARQ